MKILNKVLYGYILLLIALLIYVSLVPSAHASTYEERTAIAIQQNNAEIARKHELEVQKARIEVLGRLRLLGASVTNVTSIASSRSNSLARTEQANSQSQTVTQGI